MSVWLEFNFNDRETYKNYLKIYGALSNLFRQKKGDQIPYLDSKFQETLFANTFNCKNVDIGNTPHDILAIVNNRRIGIGVKTWMNTKPSYQKVMQLKAYRNDFAHLFLDSKYDELAYEISKVKNERLLIDYKRLDLNPNENIYHYITRDKGKFVLQECTYPQVNLENISHVTSNNSALNWTDGFKYYKYTYSDCQIWQMFGPVENGKSTVVDEIQIEIFEDPFRFLLDAYNHFKNCQNKDELVNDYVVVYLPLYSFKSKEVENKSGLNAWNASPKSKNCDLRPLNEVYVPIPRDFHLKNPDFFVPNIFEFEKKQEHLKHLNKPTEDIQFRIHLPNGKSIPGRVTQSGYKGFQSGSLNERDANGKLIGQSALGQWLLIDVLGLKNREVVSREWLRKKGIDSIKLWRKKDDYKNIFLDVAPFGSFEKFMLDNSQL
ncbi:hypothetical protein [Taylorella equigenitalis]|uniref:hypothetical protein n=1 Tax=Taylorella equigenitalis TaxID=29575 RepID=UPI00237D14B3|nr:hypothetical protein [Taylorella equigenitalis]WDU54580.1 NgoFVII family restriction endonuclease [Taylorella equigenitalis]